MVNYVSLKDFIIFFKSLILSARGKHLLVCELVGNKHRVPMSKFTKSPGGRAEGKRE